MEASDIAQIVYGLIRISDDRNSMMHEDTVSQFVAKIAVFEARNKRLGYQLKDLYRKYEKAMSSKDSHIKDDTETVAARITEKSIDVLVRLGSSPLLSSSLPCPATDIKSAPSSSSLSSVEIIGPIMKKELNSHRSHDRIKGNGDEMVAKRSIVIANVISMDDSSSSRVLGKMSSYAGHVRDENAQNSVQMFTATGTAASPLCIYDSEDHLATQSTCVKPTDRSSSISGFSFFDCAKASNLTVVGVPIRILNSAQCSRHLSSGSVEAVNFDTDVVAAAADDDSTIFNMGVNQLNKNDKVDEKQPNGDVVADKIKNISQKIDGVIEDIEATYFEADEEGKGKDTDLVCGDQNKGGEIRKASDLSDIEGIEGKEPELRDQLIKNKSKSKDRSVIIGRSHLLSVKQKASLQKWLETFGQGMLDMPRLRERTIKEIVKNLPLSRADFANIRWSEGHLHESAIEALLISLRTFLEQQDLIHLFPSVASPIESDFSMKMDIQNSSMDVDLLADTGTIRIDAAKSGGSRVSCNSVMAARRGVPFSGGIGSSGCSAISAGNVTTTDGHTGSINGAGNRNSDNSSSSSRSSSGSSNSSSSSSSSYPLKRYKTSSGYRGIDFKENTHVNVRQPFLFSKSNTKSDGPEKFSKTVQSPSRYKERAIEAAGGNSTDKERDRNKDKDKDKGRFLGQALLKRRFTVHETPVTCTAPAVAIAADVVKGGRVVRCVEVVRKKNEREALRGHQCSECAAYYTALVQQGIVSEENMEEMLQQCSRHKAKWSPPHTPEGYWDLTVRTPEKWG